ncbi:DEAD/DEAH box helicase, partial [Candidatus Marsarchaeota archaeon]|nr:DEAD/DEAH box helicase [Candidatus Marsarchaeota archaeon]
MDYSWEDLNPYNAIVNTTGMDARAYQINILKSIFAGRNTLVVLPTGLGKTLIAVFAISKSLYEGKKALMLAPTRPLSEQHYDSLLKLLKINAKDIFLATGSVRGSKRQEMESASRVVVATPQTIYNDMIKGRLSLSDFGIVIFDECHKAVGKYSYTYIANECKERGIQVLGLTASPGSDQKRIKDLVGALDIEKIEARSSLDDDVAPYVMGTSTRTVYVEKSESIKAITAVLKPVIDEHLHNLYKIGMSPFKEFERMPKGKLIEIGNNISKIEAKNYRFNAMFNYVYLLNLVHAYDLISTEGIYPFLSYFESLQSREKKSRSLESMLKNAEVKKAID